MGDRIRRSTLVLTCFSLIFLQFQFGHILNFPLTSSLFTLLPVVFLLFSKRMRPGLIVCLIGTWTFLTLNFLANIQTDNYLSFGKAFALISLNTVIFGIIITSDLKSCPIDLPKALNIVLLLDLLLSGIQLFIGYRHFPILARIFGPFTNDYQFLPDLNASINRPSGFYIEPSFNALVCFTLFSAIALIPNVERRSKKLLICLVCMTITFSAAGIISLLGIYLVSVLGGRSHNKFRGYPALLILLFTGKYIYSRLTSITVSGSSANFRLVSPFQVLKESLTSHPLGLPVGTLRDVMRSAGFLNGSTVGTSLDNGWFLIIFYFGLIGILILVVMIALSIKFSLRLRSKGEEYWGLGFAPFLAFGFTGGIFLPDFAILLSIIIYSLRVRVNQLEKNQSQTQS